MNRDAEAAALTCGSLFLQQFRFFWIIARNTSGSFPLQETAWPLPSSQNVVMPPASDMFCYYPDIFPPRTECDTLPSRRDAHGTGAHRPVKSLLLQRVSPFRKAFAFQQFFCCVSVCHCSRPRFRNLSSVNLHRRIAQCRDVFPVVAGQKNRFSFLF